MANTCREDLKNYALRKLGAPVLQINVAPEQIEDRIDDALKRFWEFHHEASYVDFVARQITQQEIDTKQIVLDDWIYQVLGIVMLANDYSDFNLEYNAFMQNLGTQFLVYGDGYPPGGGISSYTVSQSYLSMVRDFFSREKRVQFNHLHNILYIHSSLSPLKVGDYLVLESYRFTDPDTYRKTWNDQWLKDYTAALIKRQWGQNMIKYSGFTLPSGITLNGRDIYQDALADLQELETQLMTEETLPIDFMVG